jgi:hypothetical protein
MTDRNGIDPDGTDPAASTMFSGGLTFGEVPEPSVPAGVAEDPAEGDGPHGAAGMPRRAPLPGCRDARGCVSENHRAVSTEAGHYLRAVAQDEAPAHFGTQPGGGPVDDDARRIWAIAFGLIARRRFEADAPLADIGRTAATAAHEHAAAALPLLDVEMLIRDALGEPVPTGEIGPAAAAGIHLLVFASIVDELALCEAELDCLITEAEALAV